MIEREKSSTELEEQPTWEQVSEQFEGILKFLKEKPLLLGETGFLKAKDPENLEPDYELAISPGLIRMSEKSAEGESSYHIFSKEGKKEGEKFQLSSTGKDGLKISYPSNSDLLKLVEKVKKLKWQQIERRQKPRE